MTQPFTPGQIYSKISFPAFNILDALVALNRERSWDLSSVSGEILATLSAARTPAKPFIVGFIPPDVTVNFVPIQQQGTALSTVTVQNNNGSGPLNQAGQVPTVKTPLTPAQALGALQAAGLKPPVLYLVAAQSATETNYWGSRGKGGGFNNYNFGNITVTNQQAQTQPWMNQGLPLKYASYQDAQSGANAMVTYLQNNGSLAAANQGLDAYMARLQQTGYLGFVGQTDATGHVVSQQDYDNYKANIEAIQGSLK